jgi:hypothetical protein
MTCDDKLTCDGNRTSCRRILRSNCWISPAVLLKIARNRDPCSCSARRATAIWRGVTTGQWLMTKAAGSPVGQLTLDVTVWGCERMSFRESILCLGGKVHVITRHDWVEGRRSMLVSLYWSMVESRFSSLYFVCLNITWQNSIVHICTWRTKPGRDCQTFREKTGIAQRITSCRQPIV